MIKKLTIQTMMVMLMTFTFIGTGYSFEQCACGQTIYTDTTLECDLECEGTAITIGADGITLDLNGHTLTGDGTGTGVYNIDGCEDCGSERGCNGVTIKDGIIDGFRFGIRLEYTENNLLEELELRNSTHKGIDIELSKDTTVRECIIIGKTKVTTWGICLDEADNNVIVENFISKNAIGLENDEGGGNLISQNTFKNNKEYDILDNKISDNEYYENKCKKSDPAVICQ